MKLIGINLDSDVKSLIVGGDNEMINELLKDIFETASDKLDKMTTHNNS